MIPITVSPRVLQPSNGKLPASVNLAVFEKDCDDSRQGTDFDLTRGFDLKITGSGLSLTPPAKRNTCAITEGLAIDPSAPAGSYSVILLDAQGDPRGWADIAVMDTLAGAIPPGLAPEVDVFWEVMSQNICSDVFGKRVAEALYCIQLKIGNNSGHPLQIAGVGFTNRMSTLVSLYGQQITIANNSYASTRAALLRQQVWDGRNLTYHAIQGVGLIMAGFTPFFSRPNAKLHFTTGASIVSGPFLQAFNLVFPDPIVPQLNNLDDQSFRDNMVIPNNSHVQTVVFVDKQSVTMALRALQFQPTTDAIQSIHGNLKDSVASTPKQSQQIMGKELADTVVNSTRPVFSRAKQDPQLVKLALGSVVIVGDEIEYLQRVQIQSNAAPAAATSPLVAAPSNLTFQDQIVTQTSNPQTITFTNSGSSALTNLNPQVSGANKEDFSVPSDTNTCTSSLGPAARCTVAVTFAPAPTAGALVKRTAALEVSFSPGSTPLVIPLSGTAQTPSGTVVFSAPTLTLDFGGQKVGQSSTKTLTILNLQIASLANLSISSTTGTNAADFTLGNNACTTVLAPGTSCAVSWSFKPAQGSSAGRTAAVTVTYSLNGTTNNQVVRLSGAAQ